MTSHDITPFGSGATPLTMSSLEIAGLTGKRHPHVLRDIRNMMAKLNETKSGLVDFRSTYLDAKGEAREAYNLPKRECLILVSGYSVELRARIIDRWMQLEAALSSDVLGATTLTGMDADARKVLGGIMKAVVHRELTQIVPDMVRSELSAGLLSVRRGKTAGQIWKDHGFPPIKSGSAWLGNRLSEVGCRIADNGYGELGLIKARLFDPDKADSWLRNGGKLLVDMKITERRGQGRLRLIQPTA